MLVDIPRLRQEKTLTARQLEVLELMELGYNDRTDLGLALTPPVGVQAIHQIVLRIRKRLKMKAGIFIKPHVLDEQIKTIKEKRLKRAIIPKEKITVNCLTCKKKLILSYSQKRDQIRGQRNFYHPGKCAKAYVQSANEKMDDFIERKREIRQYRQF